MTNINYIKFCTLGVDCECTYTLRPPVDNIVAEVAVFIVSRLGSIVCTIVRAVATSAVAF